MSRYQLPDVQEIRAIKTGREVANIIKAQRLSEVVLQFVVRRVRVGVSEIELARFIVAEFKRRGIKALAFEPIVAFGAGSADIHHWATKARLSKNQIVMFDFGATHKGYCSDMTRTFFFGNPSAKFKKLYSNVLAAEQKVFKALAHGERNAKKLDAIARNPLERKFGKLSFPHGLGHGVGVAIHEWPAMKPKSGDVLKPGMVVTLEPGVYINSWGGVRIEDMVHIKKHGATHLTKAAKDFSSIIIHA